MPCLRAPRELLGLDASLEYLVQASLEVAARGRQRVATVGQLAIVVREVSVHLDAGALQRPRSASAASGVVLLTSYPLTVAAAARLPARWAPRAALTTRPSRAATCATDSFRMVRASNPAPYVLSDFPRMAAHLKQLEAVVAIPWEACRD